MAAEKQSWYSVLYLQVLFAIVLGALIGWLFPHFAQNDWIKAMGDGFVKLIRMVIAPIIFCTVVSGIAHIQDAKKVGRVGVKALIYFEIVSTFALLLGLIVGNLFPVAPTRRVSHPRSPAKPIERGSVIRFPPPAITPMLAGSVAAPLPTKDRSPPPSSTRSTRNRCSKSAHSLNSRTRRPLSPRSTLSVH